MFIKASFKKLIASHRVVYMITWISLHGQCMFISLYLYSNKFIIHCVYVTYWILTKDYKYIYKFSIPFNYDSKKQVWSLNKNKGTSLHDRKLTNGPFNNLAIFNFDNAQCSGKPIFFPVPVFTNFCIL